MMSSVAVFEAAMRVKSTYMIKSWLKTGKGEIIWNQQFFYVDLHLKDGLGMKFTACSGELMPEESLTSFA